MEMEIFIVIFVASLWFFLSLFFSSHLRFFETGSHNVAQAGLEFAILLPQTPAYWDYRYVLPHPHP
jgi:hypothetical protein